MAAQPPTFCFGMNALSFMYSSDMKLLDVRSVPCNKLFPVSISPQRLQFLHEQAYRVTSAMLDSAFVFVEKSSVEGGTNRVDAYCLSHPSWGVGAQLLRQQLQCHMGAAKPSYNDTPETPVSSRCSQATAHPPSTAPCSASSSTSSSSLSHLLLLSSTGRVHPPSTSELRKDGFMRKVLDEEEVRTAFEEFLASPKAPIACEVEGDVEEQKRAEEALMRGMNLPLPARPAGMRIVDARRAVVPVECTMASYGEKWENGWMGQMVLESVVNVPYERCFIPLEVSDLVTLTDCAMMNLRIFNIHVQHCSRLLLARRESTETTHRFSESNLGHAISSYEGMGWACRHDPGGNSITDGRFWKGC